MKKTIILLSIFTITNNLFSSSFTDQDDIAIAKEMVDNDHFVGTSPDGHYSLVKATEAAKNYRKKIIIPNLKWNSDNKKKNNQIIKLKDGSWIDLSNPEVAEKYRPVNNTWERK